MYIRPQKMKVFIRDYLPFVIDLKIAELVIIFLIAQMMGG